MLMLENGVRADHVYDAHDLIQTTQFISYI